MSILDEIMGVSRSRNTGASILDEIMGVPSTSSGVGRDEYGNTAKGVQAEKLG